jgi:DNA-binding response OmpR family regulator
VLLVDDHPENLFALEAILEPLDVRMVRAASAEEALREVVANDFAVIVLDVQMPGMDGYEVARRIKRMAPPQLAPIIFVTALDRDRRQVHVGYASGAVDYLFKPLDPEVVREKVAAFVRLWTEREAEALRQRQRYADLTEDVRESEARYRTLFESLDEGFCICEMVYEDDQAVDYRFLEINPAFVRQSGLADAVGRTARQMIPGLESTWIER